MNSASLIPDNSFYISLKCPSCSEFFSQLIFQCDFGHSICEKCTFSNKKCPTCNSFISRKLRNFQLEQQLSSIECNCRFPGCTTSFAMSLRHVHEIDCNFNPFTPCLLQNCKWIGEKLEILNHFTSRHSIPHYEINANSAEYSSRLRASSLPPTAGCVKLLHSFFANDSRKVTVLTYIFMDSCKNLFYPQFRTLGNRDIKYSLKIWNNEAELGDSVWISGKVRTLNVSLEEEREKKMCVIMDLESVVNRFAFSDKIEEGHRLLHYRLEIFELCR